MAVKAVVQVCALTGGTTGLKFQLQLCYRTVDNATEPQSDIIQTGDIDVGSSQNVIDAQIEQAVKDYLIANHGYTFNGSDSVRII